MSRRDPVEKKERRASDIARRLAGLANINGLGWLEGAELWSLGKIAQPPTNRRALVETLYGESLPELHSLARS